MGFRIGNEWRPDLNIGAGALEEGFAAMGTDALLAGRPIHQPIARNSQIDAAFDTITYGKGGHVVSMIAAFMGDTKFRDGVRGYMAKHKYGNASTADFFGAMADAAGDPRILPAMQSFTDQQGVPLVTFAPAGEGKWTVTQSRYVRLGTKAPAQTWGIPLCLRQGDARLCQLLVDQSATIAVPGSGVLMPNAGGTGYYRFELPAAQWDSLIAQGSTLPGGEALAAIDSLEASFMAGRATPAQMVAAARSFAANPDSYASDGATGQLVSFDDRGLLTPAAHDGCAAWSAKCAGRNWPSWASIRAPAPMPPTIRTSSSAASHWWRKWPARQKTPRSTRAWPRPPMACWPAMPARWTRRSTTVPSRPGSSRVAWKAPRC
jgi:hypothetical protein